MAPLHSQHLDYLIGAESKKGPVLLRTHYLNSLNLRGDHVHSNLVAPVSGK